jgi:hypothetical protein
MNTPRTDAATRMAFSGEYMVPIEDAQKLERELARVTEQRDSAFRLIEYAGELLGVTPQEHKSAHGFKVLQSIKDLIEQAKGGQP